MQLTMLGTGAPLHPTRAGTGMMLTHPGCQPLMIDTCGGFELSRRLAASNFTRQQIRNVIVTHRHLDHAGGIQELLLAQIPLDIYANADTHAGINQVTAGCFPEWEQHSKVARHEVGPALNSGKAHDIGGFKVKFFDVDHRVPTLAVRVEAGGRTFAFSADCRPCIGAFSCARNADLFLCDAICATSDGQEAIARTLSHMHPTAQEAANLATQAGARRLLCTHIGRFGYAPNILAEARAHFDGDVEIAEDGGTYEV
jgi:ribonuclease BN (tRNA processing enzyme)